MKLNSLFALFFSSLCLANAWATEPNAFDKLLVELKNGTVFVQVTKNPLCPKTFILTEFEPQFRSDDAKPGDAEIYFNVYMPAVAEDNGSFVHEGHHVLYRPGLKLGRMHVLSEGTHFALGVARFKSTQTINKDSAVFEYRAKIYSAIMIASSYYKIRYEAALGQIGYYFKGNDVDPVYCKFLKKL